MRWQCTVPCYQCLYIWLPLWLQRLLLSHVPLLVVGLLISFPVNVSMISPGRYCTNLRIVIKSLRATFPLSVLCQDFNLFSRFIPYHAYCLPAMIRYNPEPHNWELLWTQLWKAWDINNALHKDQIKCENLLLPSTDRTASKNCSFLKEN